MNNWGNDYGMQNQFGVPPMNQMMAPNMMQPLMPPLCMIGEMGHVNPAPSVGPQGLIGPVLPDGQAPPGESKNDDVQIISDGDGQNQNDPGSKELLPSKSNNHSGSRDRRNRRDQDHDRDHNRRRSRSPGRSDRTSDRNRNDQGRGSRGRNDRSDRPRRDRPSKWSKNEDLELPRPGNMGMANNMMMQGMMPFNMMNNNMMGQQPIEMGNMQNMGSMQNMGNMQNMSNMQNMQNLMPNMVPGMNNMNMMQNNAIMDPMMMMNQQAVVSVAQPTLIPNQPIYLNSCMLLPPIPGTALPKRREMPPGCRTIFVGGLPTGIPEDIVHEIFQRFGGVDDIKLHRQGVCHVRFENHPSVEQSFFLSGYRFKVADQSDNEATTIFIDYALNRDDQNEFERMKRVREKTPPRIEPFTPATLSSVTEKIKLDEEFIGVAPILLSWLERGECNKKNANQFYSLIQAANHQVRRLYNEKMTLDDEFQTLKNELREKFAKVIQQFEQVAKILTVAKHQRVSDHFTKQQRRNIEMWLKMTEEVENIREEFALYFDEEEGDKPAKGTALQEKYEELKQEHENLTYELEGYRNELHLAKDEAERKFEKFKAQFIAQQALQNPGKQIYPPLPPPPTPIIEHMPPKPEPPPPTPDDLKLMRGGPAGQADAKLVSLLTAFLLVHPLGATQDYLVSYVRSLVPNVSQQAVQQVLQRNGDVFRRKSKGYGHSTEHRWEYALFSLIKHEN